MVYRDLEGREIIQPGDEVWNPQHRLWIPILVGAACVGDYVDETGRHWRRVVDCPEPSAPEPSAPEPSAPEPSAPEPSAPEPSAPEPSAPEPSIMAYEDLPPGAELLPGDQWKNVSGRWVEYNNPNEYGSSASFAVEGLCSRRPHNITQMREDFMKVVGEVHDVRQQLSRSQDAREAYERLAEDFRVLQSERQDNISLRNKVFSLESSLSHVKRQRESAEEKMRACGLEAESARTENERLKASIEEYRSEVSFLQNQLGQSWQLLQAAEDLDAKISQKNDQLQAERERLRQELAAAEALTAEAAKAGPIVDEGIRDLERKLQVRRELAAAKCRIKELESQIIERDAAIVFKDSRLAELRDRASDADRLRKLNEDLNHELQELRPQAMAAFDRANHLDLTDDVQPQESELERRAWELFASAMASDDSDISPERSFLTAARWMTYRDQRQKQSPSIDWIDSDKLGGTT